MQPSDIYDVVTVGDPAVAPDGRTVAVVVSRPDADLNRSLSDVWLVSADDGASTQLATGLAGPAVVANPRWSPDGTRIAVTRTTWADDQSETAVLVLPAAGASDDDPAVVVATSDEGVSSLCWAPGSDRLAWCARVSDVPAGTKDRDRPPRQITTLFSRLDDEGWTIDRRTQVHVAGVDGSGVRTVTSGPFEHIRVAWSPDGKTLAIVAGRHEGWDLDEIVDVWLADADASDVEMRRATDGTHAWFDVSWSPDGRRLAGVAVEPTLGWRNPRPVVLDLDSGEQIDLAPHIDRPFFPSTGGRPPVWSEDGASLIFSHEDRGRVTLVRLPAAGGDAEVLLGGDRWVVGHDEAGGTIAAVVTDAVAHGELEILGTDIRTTFTAEYASAVPALPTLRFTVPSSTGEDLDAWLVAPEGFDPDAEAADPRWPLLLSIHGGPMSQYGDRWFDEFQLLAGAGFVVVATNPHGSSGRESAFQRAVRSPLADVDPGSGWGGLDAEDLLAVVEAALARWPSLDAERVGVLGGSYGGFMTTWLLAHSDRFAAGCTERAVNNLLSEEWSSDIAGWFHRELGVSHIEHRDEYLRMSPATYADQITAPVMIIHSEQDLRCPTEQADALFVALRLLSHPDVEYWRFPGEGHEMSRSGSPFHRVRRAELITAFFDRTIGAGPR